MSDLSDRWYIRFPDGRIVRAANTSVVRQHIGSGRIPIASSVRKSGDEDWTSLQWTREFADLTTPRPTNHEDVDLDERRRPGGGAAVEASGVSARLDATQLRTVGVRGIVDELLAALDSSLVRKKLAAAGLAGVCCGLVFAVAQAPTFAFEAEAPWARWVVAWTVAVLIVTAAAGLLTRMTYVELSRMRPSHWRDGAARLGGLTFRLAAAQLLTAGLAVGGIVLLRWLPSFLLDQGGFGWEAAAAPAAAVGMILEAVLWPVVGFSFLLAPILVVEDCSVFQAIGHWLRLLREELGRVFLYQALALGLGATATLLLALPLLALFSWQPDARLLPTVAFTRQVLAGPVLAPLFLYLVVANVFIYLNLRYEVSSRR